MIKYFVAYSIVDESGRAGVGNGFVMREGPITCIDHVREVEAILKDRGDAADVVITSFQIFKEKSWLKLLMS